MTRPMPSTHAASCPNRAAGPGPGATSVQASPSRSYAHRSPYTVPPSRPPKRSAVAPSAVTVQVWSSRAAGPDADNAAAVRGSGAAVAVAIGVADSVGGAEVTKLGARVWLGDAGEPEAHPVTRSATPTAILTERGMPQ